MKSKNPEDFTMNQKSNPSEEKLSSSSSDVFYTIRHEKSIIYTVSDSEVKKKKEDSPVCSKSFISYKDVVLNET